MADCECLPKCPFFNDKMSNMPSMANLMKKKYCQGDKSECARYLIASKLGRDKVPSDLFPNQLERAFEILKGF
ncbi:hypothetical protein JXR93_09770 [bacterium]|nr:hypothetical protein [bacterium]